MAASSSNTLKVLRPDSPVKKITPVKSVIRKSCPHDYRYVRAFPVQLGGAAARLIPRKFRAMLHDRHSLLLTCERNEQVRAFVALKQQVDPHTDERALLIEYFGMDFYSFRTGVAAELEERIVGIAVSLDICCLKVNKAVLGDYALTFYRRQGYTNMGDQFIKEI